MAWHFSRAEGWSDKDFKCENCKARKLHRKPGRNCSQFPDEWQARPKNVWVRRIEGQRRTSTKGQTVPWSAAIPETGVTECPVSYITPESMLLLEMVQGSRVSHEVTGARLFGSDTARWPAKYFDAVRVVHFAQMAEEKVERKYGGQ